MWRCWSSKNLLQGEMGVVEDEPQDSRICFCYGESSKLIFKYFYTPIAHIKVVLQ
jgi:hypothetical protein